MAGRIFDPMVYRFTAFNNGNNWVYYGPDDRSEPRSKLFVNSGLVLPL